MHSLEPPELAQRLLAALGAQHRVFDLDPVLVDLVGSGIDLSELALDGP